MMSSLPSLGKKIEVGKVYKDRQGTIVMITRGPSRTGWYYSEHSSYKEDGTCYHGTSLDLISEAPQWNEK